MTKADYFLRITHAGAVDLAVHANLVAIADLLRTKVTWNKTDVLVLKNLDDRIAERATKLFPEAEPHERLHILTGETKTPELSYLEKCFTDFPEITAELIVLVHGALGQLSPPYEVIQEPDHVAVWLGERAGSYVALEIE